MRQIALDTETTGIGHDKGHRVIEIGCVELINRKLTGNHFHVYLNPQREVDEGAFRVHGISNHFLQDKPLFQNVLDEFIQFIDGSELIIHNAVFDVGFLNSEFKHVRYAKRIDEHCTVFDTLTYARKKHAGQRNTLDALCKRYYVDNSNRQLHGALMDAELLALVYLAMTGGQTDLFAEPGVAATELTQATLQISTPLSSTSPVIYANAEELQRHHAFLDLMVGKSQ